MRRLCAVALLFAVSCSRCGGPKSADTAEELLPPHPSGAVITAPLAALGSHFDALATRIATLPGGEQVLATRRQLAAQLGFDPFTREGQLAAGLDPDRGAAVAIFTGTAGTSSGGTAAARPEWVAALPLTRPDLFAQTVQRLLVERFGATPGAQPQTFERGGTTIAYKIVRGYGMIARGVSPAERLNAPEKPDQSLAPVVAPARQRLGAQDLIVWAPAGSALPRRFSPRPLPGEVAVSLQTAPQGVAARLNARLPPPDAAKAREALPGGGASLVELLPADAPLRLRLGVSPASLYELARPRMPELFDKLKSAPELFAALAPGAALSLAVTRNASLAEAIDYGFDWRHKSPFDTVQLVALAQVADRARFAKALDQLVTELPSVGAAATREGDDVQITYAGFKGARFGVRDIEGKPVAYLLGGDLKPADLHRTPKGVNPEGAALYEDTGAALRADFGKLAIQIHTLPESTYGTGPQSYVTRSIVSQVIDPLRPLKLTLDAQAQPDSFGATLDVEIDAP